MYINKLYLRAFGKFVYKRIYLGKKFNIIYGENETGKSTIHNFIESVLYGFDDDVSGTELNKKYKPWDSNLYKGSLTIDGVNGKKHLVTKDFLLDTTQVFNKDLDDDKNPSMQEENIDYPGEYFFNINKVSYRNTVSIKQLGNKTDKELSIELKNKIINLSSSRDESISINRILSTLNNIKDEAGSEDNPKTLLGQYALRLKELEKARENTLNANRQVMFLAMEKKKTNSKIQQIDMTITELNKDLIAYELSIEKHKYLKAAPVKTELDEVNEKLYTFINEDCVQKYSKNDYEEACKLYSSLSIMRNDRHNLRNKRDESQANLNALEEDLSNNISDDFDIAKMNANFNAYKTNKITIKDMESKIKIELENVKNFNVEEINKFLENYDKVEENNTKIEITKVLLNDKHYELMKNFIKKQNIKSFFIILLGTGFIALAILAGYAAYYYNIQTYYYGTAIGILGIILYMLSSKSRRRAINANKEIESIECRHADYSKNIETLTGKVDEILKSSECEDLNKFKNMYENKKSQQNIINEKLKLLDYDKDSLNNIEEINNNLEANLLKDLKVFCIGEITDDNLEKANEIYKRKDSVKADILKYKSEIDNINQSLNKMDKEIIFEEKRLNMILSSNNMKSIDEFKKAVEHYERYIDLKNKKEYCENLLNSILGNTDFDELKVKTEKSNSYEIKEIDKNEQQITIFKMKEEKNKLLLNINNIDKEIDEIENQVRNLAEVEEEIEFYENKKSVFKEKIQVADIAAEKIIEISDSIKGDFMPLLKKSISENFAYVTSGKYKEVNIDKDMNISVVSEDNQDRNIEIESLSGGTLDQLYLSLRISLSNILSGNQNLPIILDDSFVQYDSNRLKKSIEMLARESERRQIILFTCQEREIEFAKQMNVKFNLIKL